MTNLSTYTDKAISELLDSNGAFFAFSNSQLEDGQKASTKYVSMGAGLICPETNAKAVNDGLNRINELAVQLDMFENTPKHIIWREFANYECQIVGDPEDAIRALSGYPITEEDIHAQWDDYFAHCVENDYF